MVAGALLAAVLPASPPTVAGETERSLEMYRGLGTWIDLYDGNLMNHPRRTVRRAAARGVQTIYVETANYLSSSPVVRTRKMTTLIGHAHRLESSRSCLVSPRVQRPRKGLPSIDARHPFRSRFGPPLRFVRA